MSTYTYPVTRPEGALSTADVHLLLSRPNVVARRLGDLMDHKFIADFLLQGRYEAVGGSILYESGDEVFAPDDPEAVEPGATYPKTILTRGEVLAARTVKWGLETEITDEAISRLGLNPVDRALGRLANSIVRYVDGVAWSVIEDKVTSTSAATGTWTTVQNIVTSLLKVRTEKEDLEVGINLDTIALTPMAYAEVMGIFLNAGVLPRESANPMLTGELPTNLLGWTWVASRHVSGTDPWVFDRTLLGGMADEHLNSPGYTRAGGFGVEVQIERIAKRDAYEPRARRVTVPVVTEPLAGATITGTK